jgi:hypothetical protein
MERTEMENIEENLNSRALVLKEHFEQFYSEIGYVIDLPNKGHGSGWKGRPLISIWDYSSSFNAGFCLNINVLVRVY